MALGVTSYSEAPFSAESPDVIAYTQGISLTSSIGDESAVGTANVSVTGSQATINIASVVAGSSVLVEPTGLELTTTPGEETINIGVSITGLQLSITNKTSTQDTLTAFGEAPFATLSPDTFNIPSVIIETTTGAGQLPSFLLQSTLGTFSVSADGNVSVVVTEHTMNTSVGDVSITGTANVSVTGTEMTMSMGEESAFTDIDVSVTGNQLTLSQGEEVIVADANVSVTGIQLNTSIGNVVQETSYDVTGSQLNSSIGNVTITLSADITVNGIQITSSIGNIAITAWEEIDPGVSNTWTEISTGVSNTWTEVDKAA